MGLKNGQIVMVLQLVPKVKNMSVNFTRENFTDKELSRNMAENMLGNIKIIKEMDKEPIRTQMEISTLVSGKNINIFGHGIYTYANGDTYVGEWKKDAYNAPDNLKERHGQGTLTKADGTIEKGIWKKGKLIKPKQ